MCVNGPSVGAARKKREQQGEVTCGACSSSTTECSWAGLTGRGGGFYDFFGSCTGIGATFTTDDATVYAPRSRDVAHLRADRASAALRLPRTVHQPADHEARSSTWAAETPMRASNFARRRRL